MTKQGEIETRDTTDASRAKVQWLWKHILNSDGSTTLVLEPIKVSYVRLVNAN